MTDVLHHTLVQLLISIIDFALDDL